MSFNEVSARYTEVKDDKFYIPPIMRIQHKNNRQASVEANEEFVQSIGFDNVDDWNASCQDDYRQVWEFCYNKYQRLIEKGVTREQARGVLPIGQYSSLYITFNLRSLLHFAHLRTHEGAQYEIQQYAKVFLDEAERVFPVSVAVFKDMYPDTFGESNHLSTLLASK